MPRKAHIRTTPICNACQVPLCEDERGVCQDCRGVMAAMEADWDLSYRLRRLSSVQLLSRQLRIAAHMARVKGELERMARHA